jgi:hypothetical protein
MEQEIADAFDALNADHDEILNEIRQVKQILMDIARQNDPDYSLVELDKE